MWEKVGNHVGCSQDRGMWHGTCPSCLGLHNRDTLNVLGCGDDVEMEARV